jgi:PPM family protein phosphatase
MTPTFYGLSDIGLSRTSNQDVWIARPEIGLFALADGIGGRKAGALAAQETIAHLHEAIRNLAEQSNYFHDAKNLSHNLRLAIEYANTAVYRRGIQTDTTLGMGSTLCCVLWTPEEILHAHVGDSRIYRFHNNQLHLLTRDHSLLSSWMASQKKEHPKPPKNIITKAMGMAKRVHPEIACLIPIPGDLFLLCSDGLTDAVGRDELEGVIRSHHSLEKMAYELILAAKNRGSGDNITVLMVRM